MVFFDGIGVGINPSMRTPNCALLPNVPSIYSGDYILLLLSCLICTQFLYKTDWLINGTVSGYKGRVLVFSAAFEINRTT